MSRSDLPLGFYDFDRQPYAASLRESMPDLHKDIEIWVGGYSRSEGGVDERGELRIVLCDLHRGRRPLVAQLCVFTDAHGALLELIELGLLDRLRSAELRSGDDLSRLLLELGLDDHSAQPLPATC